MNRQKFKYTRVLKICFLYLTGGQPVSFRSHQQNQAGKPTFTKGVARTYSHDSSLPGSSARSRGAEKTVAKRTAVCWWSQKAQEHQTAQSVESVWYAGQWWGGRCRGGRKVKQSVQSGTAFQCSYVRTVNIF